MASDQTPSDRTPVSYAQLRKVLWEHPVRHSEVPVEYAISLPVPTLRWLTPSVTVFAGPAKRAPRTPLRLGAPDRWWAVSQDGRRLTTYGLTSALPLADDPTEEVVVDRGARSPADLDADRENLDQLMDAVLIPFLSGKTAEETLRGDLQTTFTATVTADALRWYERLAPDFFGWLAEGRAR